MRIVLVSLLLLISVSIFAQDDSTITAARKKEIDDSITKVLQNVSDSIGATAPIYETVDTAKNVNPGLDYFVRMEERQRKDEKKSAVLYIILGILLLGILIIGLMRKPKKKVKE